RPFKCEDFKGVHSNAKRTRFRNAANHRNHMKNMHNNRNFECQECGKKLKREKSLRMHEKTHLPDYDPLKKKTKCEECGKLLDREYLKKHMKTHLDDGDARPFKCQVCRKTFRSSTDLKHHTNI
ncbi:hypothetical protein PMAYCL1PPCAC_02206, partial [Pristionchus mayeri]